MRLPGHLQTRASYQPPCDRTGQSRHGTFGEMFPIAVDDLDGLCTLAGDITADLVVIGPEVPLLQG